MLHHGVVAMHWSITRRGRDVKLTYHCTTVPVAKEVEAALEELLTNLKRHSSSCIQAILTEGAECSCEPPLAFPKLAAFMRPSIEIDAASLAALAPLRESGDG